MSYEQDWKSAGCRTSVAEMETNDDGCFGCAEENLNVCEKNQDYEKGYSEATKMAKMLITEVGCQPTMNALSDILEDLENNVSLSDYDQGRFDSLKWIYEMVVALNNKVEWFYQR